MAAKETDVYVGNLSYQLTEEEIKDLFEKAGEIKEVRLVKDNRGKSKGFCFITFATKKAAEEAVKMNGEELEGREIKITLAEEKPPAKERKERERGEKEEGGEKKRIHIGNLPYDISENELKDLFETAGEIEKIELIEDRDRKGKNRGFGFITFATKEAAANALEFDGVEIDGREMRVDLAKPTKERSPREPREPGERPQRENREPEPTEPRATSSEKLNVGGMTITINIYGGSDGSRTK